MGRSNSNFNARKDISIVIKGVPPNLKTQCITVYNIQIHTAIFPKKAVAQNHENKIMNAHGSWRCSFCLSFLLSFDSFDILFSRRSLALLESDIPLLLFKHSYKSFVESQKNLLFCILVFINQLAQKLMLQNCCPQQFPSSTFCQLYCNSFC